jgi:hypothetical protein
MQHALALPQLFGAQVMRGPHAGLGPAPSRLGALSSRLGLRNHRQPQGGRRLSQPPASWLLVLAMGELAHQPTPLSSDSGNARGRFFMTTRNAFCDTSNHSWRTDPTLRCVQSTRPNRPNGRFHRALRIDGAR